MSRAVTRPPTVGLVLRVRIGEAVADVELLQERSTGWAPGLGGAETPSGEPAGAPDRLPLPDRVRPPSSKSFLFVLAASQGSLQRLLHRVSTFLALVGEHRIPALVLLEAHPTHRRPALHALLLRHRESHAPTHPRGSATSPNEPTVE